VELNVLIGELSYWMKRVEETADVIEKSISRDVVRYLEFKIHELKEEKSNG